MSDLADIDDELSVLNSKDSWTEAEYARYKELKKEKN